MLRAIGRHRAQNILQLAPQTRVKRKLQVVKLFSMPRQPFVGLTLMAATGIITAEVVSLPPTALTSVALVFGICILIALCWPNLPVTYLIVAAGFFLLHKFA